MLNKTYKNVWKGTTRTYVAASEVAKRRGAKSASASGVLLAAGAGLFGGLALPASAAGSIDQYIAVSTTLTEGSEPTSVDNSKVNAMAVGPNAVSNGANALAVGAKTLASLDGTTAVGSAAAALAVNATVIGAGASTSSDADNGVAIGYMAAAEGVNTLGLGARASAFGDDSIALGTGALTSSNAAKTIAIGSGASASAAGGIALGAGSKADRTNALSIGNSGLSRQIINVAAGTQNGDVVNVSQLKGALESIGGGATVDTDGTIRKPAYTIKGQTYSDVGAALSALVTSTAAASADAVQYDSTSHDTVTLGSTGTPVRITNVRAAALSADSLDAVNGSQLFATNAAVTQNTSDIAANTSSITNLDQRVTDNTTTITNLDARTTTIEGDVSNITNQITNGELGLVQQDQTSRNLTVAKDTDGTSIDFTGTAGARELTGVAAGTTDTSAANVGQLKPMVAALGGGAQINADGSVSGPTYHMQGGTQTTVGDALGSLDSGLTTLQQNMESGGIGLVTQDSVSRII
ncbi:MAG: trimeric autotransporter adhesin, partial [Paraburkholderia sp.]|nr:trimeric autotransporter adhesin [Paraburkholderia sp.]